MKNADTIAKLNAMGTQLDGIATAVAALKNATTSTETDAAVSASIDGIAAKIDALGTATAGTPATPPNPTPTPLPGS